MDSGRTRDPVTIVSLLITVVALVGMVVLVPSVVPRPLRDLVGLGPHRVADAPEVSGDGSYKFLVHQEGDPDAPVGYDPCKRIHVRVNLDGAPSDGLDLVKAAMRRVEELTGLRFAYDGTTDARPRWESESVPMLIGQPRTTPVLVSWATADEVSELAGDVAGVGGSLPAPNLGGRLRYVTGGVTLDADDFADLDRTEEGRQQALAITMHEFGHLVGLAHVNDPNELMNGDNLGLLDFGPGDRIGLARVGSTSCA